MSSKFTEKSLNHHDGSSDDTVSSETQTIFRIAIIGSGAAAVATLFGLLEYLPSNFNKKFQITIFEKSFGFGPGYAYQCDSNELLMNMTSSTTSIFAHHAEDFWEWTLKGGCGISSDHVMSRSGVAPYGYISRQFFGMYLKSRLEDAILALEELGVEVILVNVEVVDIAVLSDNKFNVIASGGKSTEFNCAILCTGNNSPQDIFRLVGKSQYVNNPYPVNNYLKLIKRTASVGIIGGQLTAADIAVVLANHGHQGPINFFTRDSNFPLARCQQRKYALKYLTLDNLEILKSKNNKGISVRQVLRLARKEFLRAGIAWNTFFSPSNIEYSRWIQSLLDGGRDFSSWQNLAIKTDAVIGDYWNALSSSDKELFMNKFHRLWAAKRVPLPMHTALKLHSLFQAGILTHHPYLRVIHASGRNRFTAFVGESGESQSSIEVDCDWIINATGPAKDIGGSTEMPLIKNLLKSGAIIKNPHGGIMLDYETSIVKSASHRSLNYFYAIGQLTSGTYYFVSSLDMVSMRAKNVARHIVESLGLRQDQKEIYKQTQDESLYAS
ncbi:FAD/NAD(P)-binding protein [Polynucleobacter sp. JS-Safj-400b-B2]|uniref:FAD/NAD(P)-binding protein n=1 Tax=Polynucleobacter sp. JS-Safj-400b-B2 TaxID=2576921 RepID=UPI001C0E8E2B|nr:FAD/NAD(P)-binding protein [Polynucleobacter sp. JS-Safj-400b-B2]MBU3624780.1 FAD/NAD(P)-binding protein [Polynucleobacter sp. JS-Safj-400b-B2]